ncbi:uncharacterized protein [Henckelia pumila]|uniref:uncharacterized protein isoform X2 n=1 Tax=Henckelia pumila TaxID=405737 RepID=UPI003C6E30E2
MAQRLDEGKFWLPSEFLTDDELLMGLKVRRLNDFRRHGYASSFGSSSDLFSHAELVLGSAETESDEDDYVTALAQKLAYATLGDTYPENTMGWKFSGSHQSTLCSNVTGCGCMSGLSRVSRASLPPDIGANAAAWRSLLAAVERDARMRLIEETAAFCSGNSFARSRKPDTTGMSQGSVFYPNQSRVSHQQLQAAQFHEQLQQQQHAAGGYLEQAKIAHQQMARNTKKNGGSGNQSSSSMASWPDIPHCQPPRQRSSGTKALFLGEESETKSKRSGTGVFLPRNLGATTPFETRKKTVMNSNLKSMDLQQPHGLTKRNDFLEANAAAAAASKHGNMVSIAEQRRTLRPVPARMNQALKLPQEWTY